MEMFCILLGIVRMFIFVCVCVCFVAHSCLTLCSPIDCSLPGSSAHGIFRARILEHAEGFGAGGVHTAKASRGESSFRGKGSAPGCIPKLVLPRPD